MFWRQGGAEIVDVSVVLVRAGDILGKVKEGYHDIESPKWVVSVR